MTTIRVNMRHMNRWQVTQDNVQFYDSIVRTKGVVTTLDARPYVEWLCEFNVFYTEEKSK